MDNVTLKDDGRLEFHHDDELMNRIAKAVWPSRGPEYGKVDVPMLAVVPAGHCHPGVPLDATDEFRRAADRYREEKCLPWPRQRTETFRQAAPTAHMVVLDSPIHHIFIAKEDETVKAMEDFLVT